MRDIKYRDDGRPEDLLQELGYETQDIAYRKFAVYIGYFFGFFIICAVLGFGIMYLMSPTKLAGGRMANYQPKTQMPLSAPLLQSNITARTDIMSLRRNETAALDSSGVIDQSHGVYRIPVDQAINDVANMADGDRSSMGLPPETATATAPAPSTSSNVQGGTSTDAGLTVGPTKPAGTAGTGLAGRPSQTKPISNSAQRPSHTNRGESATTKPKGGNGG